VVFPAPYGRTLNRRFAAKRPPNRRSGCAAITYGFREGKRGFCLFPQERRLAKSSPEKLAAALRANLKRCKKPKPAPAPESATKPAEAPPKSPKSPA
jgi:hypothetical protein